MKDDLTLQFDRCVYVYLLQTDEILRAVRKQFEHDLYCWFKWFYNYDFYSTETKY